jgi:hypothetical protein
MGYYTATISTDGSGDGSNVSATTPIGKTIWNADFKGIIMGARYDDNGAAATADVTLSEPYGLQRTFLIGTDVAADASYFPQVATNKSDSTATGLYGVAQVDSNNLKVTVAQGGTSVTDAIIVTVLVLED